MILEKNGLGGIIRNHYFHVYSHPLGSLSVVICLQGCSLLIKVHSIVLDDLGENIPVTIPDRKGPVWITESAASWGVITLPIL